LAGEKGTGYNKGQIAEYDLRPQLKPSAAFNATEKSKFVSEKVVKNYDI